MDISAIKKVFLFSTLDEEELELVKKVSRLKKFNKGDMIFFDTEPYLGFYVLLEGMVKIYKISKDGKEHILHLIERYNTFAEVPIFENAGAIFESDFCYPANVMALEDGTEALLIPHHAFIELIENNPPLSMKIISGFAKRLRHLNNHIEEITLKDVTKRVAGYILSQYKKKQKSEESKREGNDKIVKLEISKNDLASYLGTILETLSRTFRKFQDEEVIEVNGKEIRIMDLKKLKELAE